ncbi:MULTISPECIES: 3-phosphoshikimate 1-carboxyvinyltransferase [Streptomyces]|uniref:3-phosphoshikimate 1-carboxyvinyltransferase n=1 Tax=Streptomyces TaxID=1883 RepID=UPI00167BEFF1|nr:MULTISPECIES: 3-phosphoshikimate 1-carboxyvinyltransferase [Streptomyces]MBK3520917.1 3-phosphoshikimate 1-carboxyvinyltransferase [Streptomyces sp. MBT70]GGR70059.1 3-phosphoshikimate 1-carboxyvinyltransferase [Streptomyces eurythermus]
MTTVPAPPEALYARVPGSKSLTNRALLLAAAAEGTSVLTAPLISDDTMAFRQALGELGVRIRSSDDDGAWQVTGLGRGPRGTGRIWCADAGTAARFLPPLAAAGHGDFVFTGSDQLTARPVAPLADALRRLGAEVDTGPDGTLPLRVRAEGLDGGELEVDGSLSSQFLSGLLMAAPLLRGGLLLKVRELVSRPYVDMTIALMRHFGAGVAEDTPGAFAVRPTGYRAADLRIEPDASTASYFLAAAAVTGSTVTVPGLGHGSLQGDVRFAEVLERAGARVRRTEDAVTVTGTGTLRGGFAVDMGEISDTFMTLAAIAPLADAPLTIHGIGHARLKESDRIEAVARNLRALGVRTDTGRDWITVHPGNASPARIACHRDHRIAMAFSVLNLRTGNLTLDDPGCVAKTFPGFHEEFHRLFPGHPLPAGPARASA